MRRRGWLGLALAALMAHGSALARVPPAAQPPLRVLLIGNSYTKFNVMPKLLQRLSGTVAGARPLHVDAETHGGYSLRMHWNAGLAAARIRSGHYDVVVLQSHSLSALDHADELDEYAQRFKALIEKAGARAVLYETWARKDGARLYRTHDRVRSFSEMSALVGDVYAGLAARLGIRLAPVGRAFAHEQEANLVELYRSDGSHPTPAGSFLVACVLYGAVTGEDPRNVAYVPFGLAAEAAAELKTVAAQTLAAQPAAPVVPPIAPIAPAIAPPSDTAVAVAAPAVDAPDAADHAALPADAGVAEPAAVEVAPEVAADALPGEEPIESAEPAPLLTPVAEPVASAPPLP